MKYEPYTLGSVRQDLEDIKEQDKRNRKTVLC